MSSSDDVGQFERPSSSASNRTAPPTPQHTGPDYTVPEWAAQPSKGYSLEVLKEGRIVGQFELSGKDHFLVGRTELNDLMAEHASVSRHHAVLQFSSDGFFYVYDLESTHGTKINKALLNPKRYYRLRVGQMVRFGASTRIYILDGPDEIQQQENLRALEIEQEVRKKLDKSGEERENPQAADGATWGMDMDAPAEEDGLVDDEANDTDAAILAGVALEMGGGRDSSSDGKEPFFVKDPRKAIRVFFDRFGEEPDYSFEEQTVNKQRLHFAALKLPVPTKSGQPIIVTSEGSHRRREAMIDCALRACRLMQAKNMLLETAGARNARKAMEEEDEDDDDDEFYDRTNDRKRKEQRRNRRSGKTTDHVETYESLLRKREEISTKQAALNDELAAGQLRASGGGAGEMDEDALDTYMLGLGAKEAKTAVKRLKKELGQIDLELADLDKLLAFLKPSLGPTLDEGNTSNVNDAHAQHTLPPSASDDPTGEETPATASATAAATVTVTAASAGARDAQRTTAQSRVQSLPLPASSAGGPGPTSTEDAKAKRKAEVERLMAEDTDVRDLSKPVTAAERIARLKTVAKEVNDPNEPSRAGTEPEAKRLKLHPALAQAGFHDLVEGEASGDYQDWVPPQNQRGDGRTALNEKLGY